MVSRSISTCEQLGRVSFAADYLFRACIPHTDSEGRLRGSAWDIKSQVVPKRGEITVDVIPALITELAAAIDHKGEALVERYEVAGEVFLYFPGHWRHQKIRRGPKGEGPSRLPSPPSASLHHEPPGSTPEVNPRGEPPGSTPGHNPQKGSTSLRSLSIEFKSETTNGARDLPNGVGPFLDRFYANAPPHRRLQVLEQLRQVLEPTGCQVDRSVRAYATPVTLARALEETLATPIRSPDRAIVVVLRKLVKGKCNEVVPPGRTPAPQHPDGAIRRGTTPTPIATVLPGVPRWELNQDELAAAREWLQEDATRLAAIEVHVDRSMAEVHPRWTTQKWCVGVRAQRIDQAVITAYRARTSLLQETA
jgi:hypothetical protein